MPVMTRPIRAAFNQGLVPTIACVNAAKTDLKVDFERLVSALQKFVDEHFTPVWGTPAKLIAATKPQKDAWTIMFLDDPDAPNALGYHDLTLNGLPISKVFVKTTLASGEKVSVTACHELCEMLVDPAINLWADGPAGTLYAYEMCDACEEEYFDIDGITMSDFVYPAYFELFRKEGSTQFDHLKKIRRPFQVLKGGYSLVRDGKQVRQIFGSLEKEERFACEDRRWHRSEYRSGRKSKLRALFQAGPFAFGKRTDFSVEVEGDDLVVRDVVCTWFGGPNDPQDSGETASGVNTREHPNILGCSLPMDGFHHAPTDGSPLPRIDWKTFVKVRNRANNRELSVPLIDLGPSLDAASGAAIDLTEAAFKLIGGHTTEGKVRVDFTIPGGAKFLGQGSGGADIEPAVSDAQGDVSDGHGMSHDVPKPLVKAFIRSPNVSSRNGRSIDMVVLHYTDGTFGTEARSTRSRIRPRKFRRIISSTRTVTSTRWCQTARKRGMRRPPIHGRSASSMSPVRTKR